MATFAWILLGIGVGIIAQVALGMLIGKWIKAGSGDDKENLDG